MNTVFIRAAIGAKGQDDKHSRNRFMKHDNGYRQPNPPRSVRVSKCIPHAVYTCGETPGRSALSGLSGQPAVVDKVVGMKRTLSKP